MYSSSFIYLFIREKEREKEIKAGFFEFSVLLNDWNWPI